MGYTHYWSFKQSPRGQAEKTEQSYLKAVKDCHKVIIAYSKANGGLSGYSAHTKLGKYGGIKVNGSGDNAHEDFSLREHYSQNLEESFNFCKTAEKPYDVVVVACLIVLAYRLKGLVNVSSNGRQADWTEGLKLAQRVLKIKSLKIPTSVRS
jgi:hypothetical protein